MNVGTRPTVGILAVQGAFLEHTHILEKLGAHCVDLRQAADLEREPLDALVLPGGESTTQTKLLRELDMRDPLKKMIAAGTPVLATCAGMILLAAEVEGSRSLPGDEESPAWEAGCLATIPMRVSRNAYGRQLGSFHASLVFAGLGDVPATFIRAPFVCEKGPGVQELARFEGRTVAVRNGDQFALAFHPELDASDRIHRMFLDQVERRRD